MLFTILLTSPRKLISRTGLLWLNTHSVSFTASIFVFWLSRKIREQNGEDSHRNNTSRQPLQIRQLARINVLVSNSLWITAFCILYLVYAVLFGIALGRWDVNKLGHCYRDRGIASPGEQHPEADLVYLSITCLYMFSLLYVSSTESHKTLVLVDMLCPICIQETYNAHIGGMALYEKKVNSAIGALFTKCISLFRILIRAKTTGLSPTTPLSTVFDLQKSFVEPALVILPLAQFLLHLYMVWAIRSANRMHLQGESEDTWGFGQVVALVQILPILKGCAKDCMGKSAVRNLLIC